MTTSKAQSSTRKRGRPRRESTANSGYSVVNQLRSDILEMIGACPKCGKPVHSVAGIAKQMGIAPLTLSNFLKGKSGLSQDIFDKVYGYVWTQKNTPVTEVTEA